jgi:hypothetical protein
MGGQTVSSPQHDTHKEQTNPLSGLFEFSLLVTITLVLHLAYSPTKKWADFETVFRMQFGGVKCV